MNTQILRNSAKRLGLALAMLFSLVLLGGISAQAQDRGRENRDRNNDRYDTNDSITYRSAVQYGLRDGMSQGRNDAETAPLTVRARDTIKARAEVITPATEVIRLTRERIAEVLRAVTTKPLAMMPIAAIVALTRGHEQRN